MAEEKKYKFTLELSEEDIINGKTSHILPVNPRQLKSIFHLIAEQALHRAWVEQTGLIRASVEQEIEELKSNK